MGGAIESEPARRAVETVARRSYGKLLALLASRTRDLAFAEDALADAFARALTEWSGSGCPANPEGWLLTVARRRAIDAFRHDRSAEQLTEQLSELTEWIDAEPGRQIPDDRLAMLFACAHPAIDPAVRAPLLLQAVLGVTAARIGAAFLVSPAAMGQRLSRAKTKIREAGIAFRVPEPEELPERLEVVLDAIYAAFTEGWIDPTGADLARRELAEEAVFLGRLCVELLPEEPEALGLTALMLYAEARRPARRTPDGEYVPLDEQDPALWDDALIAEAEALLTRASSHRRFGRYQLEAAIQSAHVHRRRTGDFNWLQILELYGALEQVTGSPVVAVNRAMALAQTEGAAAALACIDALASDARVQQYQPYWAARAHLLAHVGRHEQARQAFDIAIGLEHDPAVRRFLQHQRLRLTARTCPSAGH